MNKEFFSIVQKCPAVWMSHKRIKGGSRTAATSKMERFVKKRSTLDVAVALDPPLRTFKARTKPVQNPYKKSLMILPYQLFENFLKKTTQQPSNCTSA